MNTSSSNLSPTCDTIYDCSDAYGSSSTTTTNSPRRYPFSILQQYAMPPGTILKDGVLVMTVDHPRVQKCLRYIEKHLRLPLSVPEDVLTLVAQYAFDHMGSAAHWVIWGTEVSRKEILSVMKRVSSYQPPAISSCTDLFLQSSLIEILIRRYHSRDSTYHLVRNQPWCDDLARPHLTNPAKSSERNLRKRKQVSLMETTEDVVEPVPTKRAKKAAATRKPPQPTVIAATTPLSSARSTPSPQPDGDDAMKHEVLAFRSRTMERSGSHLSATTLVESDGYQSSATVEVVEEGTKRLGKGRKCSTSEEPDEQMMTRARRRAVESEVAAKTTKSMRKRKPTRKVLAV